MTQERGRRFTARVKQRREFRSPLYKSKVYLELQLRFAEHLRRLRRAKRWTQAAAAGAMRMKTQQYQQLESGETNVTLVTIARVAEAFDVDAVELFAPVTPTSIGQKE